MTDVTAPIRVCVTGAAGQIAYSLLYSIGNGDVFGSHQLISLLLLDIPPMMGMLDGVVMELQDCSLSLLHEVVGTDEISVAFNSIDVAILLDSMPQKESMGTKDYLKANTKMFKGQGRALNIYAKKTVKVLVVGDPANTNCLVLSKCAPRIPTHNFTCLTKIDQNRAVSQVSLRLGVTAKSIKNVIIWGNHSSTQYPDLGHATVRLNKDVVHVKDAISDDKWIRGNFVKIVQNRKPSVTKLRNLPCAMSGAKAICDHMRAWWFGTVGNEYISMGVLSNGVYGIPKDIFYSFPLWIDKDGNYSIVEGLEISDFSREMMDASAKELCDERNLVFSFLKP